MKVISFLTCDGKRPKLSSNLHKMNRKSGRSKLQKVERNLCLKYIFLRINREYCYVKLYVSKRVMVKVCKGAKIRNQYNQVPHMTHETNGKGTNSQLHTTNETQEVSPFPAGDHNAHINRRAQRHSKHKTEKHKRSTVLCNSI